MKILREERSHKWGAYSGFQLSNFYICLLLNAVLCPGNTSICSWELIFVFARTCEFAKMLGAPKTLARMTDIKLFISPPSMPQNHSPCTKPYGQPIQEVGGT
jgi:hypothetical protein